MSGQINWKGRDTGTDKNFIVEAAMERGLSYEYRHRSAIGRLSAPVTQRMIKDGSRMRSVDISKSAVIQRKEITSGDEARFTLIQNIKGSATHGDAPVRTGDYLAYLHKSIRVNAIRTPGIPLMEEMSSLRVKDILGGEENEIRRQLEMYLAEEYTYDAYGAFFNGASKGILSVGEVEGGLEIDQGRGAGNKISIEHILIPGVGEIVPPANQTSTELDNYEQRLVDALETADADVISMADPLASMAKYGIRRQIISDLRDYVVDAKIAGLDLGQNEKWYVAVDPSIMKNLTNSDGELYEAWKMSRERSANNPLFGYDYIELDDFIFFKDPYLKKFRPTGYAGGSEVTWGSDNRDLRDITVTSNWAPFLIMGKQALMEATSGKTKVTKWEGKHDQGMEIAAHIKQSFARTNWKPKDGRNNPILNQSSALVLMWTPSSVFTPTA